MHFLFLFVHTYGFLGMFTLVAIENMGIPLPTEAAYIIGQAMIVQGRSPYWVVFSVLLLGHLFGSLVSYWIGRSLATSVKNREFSEVQQKLQSWFQHYGNPTVFATRLIGYVRPWSSYVAGIAGVPFLPFLIFSTLGSIILNAVTLAFTNTIVYFWQHYPFSHYLILFSFSIGFILVLWQAWRRRTRSGRRSRSDQSAQ